MNSSMYTADRTTHLKIVVVGLTAALLIAVIGISARGLNLGTDIMAAQGLHLHRHRVGHHSLTALRATDRSIERSCTR